MPSLLPRQRLIRISKARLNDTKQWKEGVSLESDSGLTIDYLILRAASDRWRLAHEHRRQANKLLRSALFRSAVSRYYYAMYHAMRGCAYLYHGGDDHEKHSDLPLHIPGDFLPGVNWQNKLKDARELRNSADYDPYPHSDGAWRKHAVSLKLDADQFIAETRAYLRNRGCTL